MDTFARTESIYYNDALKIQDLGSNLASGCYDSLSFVLLKSF